MTGKAPIPVLMLALLCVTGLVGEADRVNAQSLTKPQPRIAHYQCPMHPEVSSLKRGRCPKCGMTLRPIDDPAGTGMVPESSSATSSSDSTSISSSRIPDGHVVDQYGKRLNFYSDLIKGKTFAINFIFTTCTTICPPMTATFRRVQQELKDRAVAAQLISISVDPDTDTPERLRDFAAKFKAEAGWTFVTGEKSEIDSLLRALGVPVIDKNDHTPMIIVGNDVNGYWTRTLGLSSPAAIVKVIREAATPR